MRQQPSRIWWMQLFRDWINGSLVICLDDIFVFSDSREKHLSHSQIFLISLQEHELFVGKKAYDLMRDDTKLLDLFVGNNGLKIDDDGKALFRDWPTPNNITGAKIAFRFGAVFTQVHKIYIPNCCTND